jgi:hypothetical protein
MKSFLASLVLFMAACHLGQAQLPTINKGTVMGAAQPGQLLTQFVNMIKPTSFLSSFSGAKEGILAKAQKATSAMEIASTVSSLVGYIKPSMFKTEGTGKNLLDMSSKVKTMSDAAGLLKGFEGGLEPNAMTAGWSGMRTGWLNALGQLK